ncbi:MAG: hypothetical protein Q7T97_02395 [Burkholderiaceae bacterium]|nr:hypothetical protein [Burkholderiaceae bacterium]
MNPQPKFPYIRSKALLEACRYLSCQHCDIEDGTVVAAHSNQSRHGKGRSIKASDVYVAALCSGCHYIVDQGLYDSREERQRIWTDAWTKTVTQLVQLDWWPSGIPVPDTTDTSEEI